MSDPTPRIGRPPQDLLPRFWNKVDRCGTDECWPWLGSFLPSGYGAFWLGHNNVTAHRASYMLLVGQIPDGLMVRHACDHKWCVNPAHLSVGTHADNMADKVERTRQARGESHGMAKWTDDMVARIKQAHAMGRRQASLAFCSGTNDRQFVHRAIHGVSWGHVRPDLTVAVTTLRTKINEDGVRRVRATLALGHHRDSIAFCAGVTRHCIVDIALGRRRAHVK